MLISNEQNKVSGRKMNSQFSVITLLPSLTSSSNSHQPPRQPKITALALAQAQRVLIEIENERAGEWCFIFYQLTKYAQQHQIGFCY